MNVLTLYHKYDIMITKYIQINVREVKMNIKLELLKNYISDFVNNHIEDFEIVEEIVCIFEKYNINSGGCHNF